MDITLEKILDEFEVTMERQLLSYLPQENVQVAREHMERFVSTMITRSDLAATYSHRFGLDWIQAFQSFSSLQPFQVDTAFNSGWRFDPAAGQFGSPGIIYGAAIHRHQMIPLNRDRQSVKVENRTSSERIRGKIASIS